MVSLWLEIRLLTESKSILEKIEELPTSLLARPEEN